MFYIKMMIRNYWEIHGTFDGIENTVLSKVIKQMSSDANMPYEEFLYAQLGYKPLAQYSIKESCELRALFVTRQYDALKKKLNLTNTKDIQQFFKSEGVPSTSFAIDNEVLDEKFKDVITLLALYYKTDINLYCIVNNRTLPLFYYLETLSSKGTNPEKLVDSLMQDKEILSSLVKIRYRKDAKLLVQGKCCITPVNYTKEEKNYIQREALKKACFAYGVNLNKLFKNPPDLVFLSFLDNEKYLKLLDFAAGVGITYKDLAESYGINVPDQMPVFCKYGVLLYKMVEDVSYVIDKSCDEETKPYKEEKLLFNEAL